MSDKENEIIEYLTEMCETQNTCAYACNLRGNLEELRIYCKGRELIGDVLKQVRKIINKDSDEQIPQWISVKDRLPDNEEEVLITYRGRYNEPFYYICKAFYTDGKHNTEDSIYNWESENYEYDAEHDSWIIPKGWWESVDFCEEFGKIDTDVIAWMSLPEPYKESEVEHE